MLPYHLLCAAIVALLFSLLLLPFRRRKSDDAWPAFWMFFLIILFASWAGGIWLAPFGPAASGVFWLPFLIVGFFVTLLLLAATPTPSVSRLPAPDIPAKTAHEDTDAEVVFGIFFWILLVALIAVIPFHYF